MRDLGRSERAEQFANELLQHLKLTTQSKIFGLVGQWGSGKTWTLTDLERHIRKNSSLGSSQLLLAKFNPWYYADEAALYAGFASFLLEQTLDRKDSRKKAAKLLEVVGPSLKFPVVNLEAVTSYAADILVGSSAPEAIRQTISDGLRNSKRQVVVVMDDLDRLSSRELLMLFKLIRLVGDIPRLHYVLAYDEQTIYNLLTQTEIANGSSERARQYLEKLIERKWEVPPLTSSQVEELVINQLPLISEQNDPTDPGIGYELESLIQRAVFTPRSAERFVDAIARVPLSARSEMHQRDFYLSMFLRVFLPGTWSSMVDNSDLLLGRSPSAMIAMMRDSSDPRAVELEKSLRESISPSWIREDVMKLVLESFPLLSEGTSRNSARGVDVPRIGHPDSFNRYVWLGLPPGDISDVSTIDNLRNLPAMRAVYELNLALYAAPKLAIASLRRNAEATKVNKPIVYAFLESVYEDDAIEEDTDTSDFKDRIMGAAIDLIEKMTDAELERVATATDELTNRPLITDQALQMRGIGRARSEAAETWVLQLKPAAIRSLSAELSRSSSIELGCIRTWRGLYVLIREDRTEAQLITRDKIDDGTWDALDVATLFLSIGHNIRGSSLLEVGIGNIEKSLGEDVHRRIIEAALKTVPSDDWHERHTNQMRIDLDPRTARQTAAYFLNQGIMRRDD